MRGHLKLVLLSSLEKNDLSGSELMKKVEKEFGWKPSCGSVYPMLNSLENENLAKVTNSNDKYHKKVYSLTTKGKAEIKKKKSQRNNLADEVVKIHNMVASVYDVNVDKMDAMVNRMKEGKMPFGFVHEEVEELQTEIFRILSNDKLNKNSKKIRKIMRKTITELKSIKSQKELNAKTKKPILKRD